MHDNSWSTDVCTARLTIGREGTTRNSLLLISNFVSWIFQKFSGWVLYLARSAVTAFVVTDEHVIFTIAKMLCNDSIGGATAHRLNVSHALAHWGGRTHTILWRSETLLHVWRCARRLATHYHLQVTWRKPTQNRIMHQIEEINESLEDTSILLDSDIKRNKSLHSTPAQKR
jgi:hypothetical protein